MTAVLRHAVETALRDLTAAWEDGGRLLLTVPVRYPSGAMATLEVAGGAETAWVSDRGFGLSEAEMFGAEAAFAFAAKAEARRHGIGFDGHAVFAAEVPLADLAVGIAAVANASATASAEAIRSASARRADEMNSLIFDRLRVVFPDATIKRQVTLAGDRAEWPVHNVVAIGDRRAVFEPVLPSAASISSKFLMFSDLARRPNLRLNAMVEDLSMLHGKGMMLQDVSTILPVGAGRDSYRAAA